MVLVLSIVAPAAVVTVGAAIYYWYSSLRATELAMTIEASSLASDVKRELDVATGTLLTLATSAELEAGDLERFKRRLNAVPRPDGARFAVSLASGEMVLNSGQPYGTKLPLRGDPDAVAHIFQSGLPQITGLYTSRINSEWLFAVDVPVWADGRVAFDLSLSIPPAILLAVLARQHLASERLASIVDGDGHIMARTRLMDTFLGRSVRESTRASIERGDGIFTSNDAEGRPVVTAYAAVPGTKWFVLVATPRALIVAALARSLASASAAILGLAAVGLFIASHHARRITIPLARLAEAARGLGRGGPVEAIVPVLREATEVSLALVGAAADLRSRAQERDAAETAQLAATARLARLLLATPVGIIELDTAGTFIYANLAAEQILGGCGQSVVGRRLDDPCWAPVKANGEPLDVQDLPSSRALRGEPPPVEEHIRSTLDGRKVVILAEVVAARDTSGQIEGALVAFQDVTMRFQTTRALSESEARFRHVANSVPALIWMCEADGQLTFVNDYYRVVFGDADVLGHAWRSLIVPEDIAPLQTIFWRARCRQTPFTATLRIRDAAGRVRWFRFDGLPRTGGMGTLDGYTGCGIDVTDARGVAEVLESHVAERTVAMVQTMAALRAEAHERGRVEDALRQSQKMEAVGQLTGGLAHDFNNMLQGVSGSLDLMLHRIHAGRLQDAECLIDTAREAVERAAALTHRLLAFSRRQSLLPRLVEPNTLISGMAELIQRTVGPAVILTLQPGGARSAILCDPHQLESSLLNLSINARDAMPQGGRLTIGVKDVALSAATLTGQDGAEPGAYVEVFVSDTGQGMDASTRLHAFDPFFTTKPLGQGSGLGLSQTYGFVRQSGGVVQLESTPGHGTTVRLCLPRHDLPLAHTLELSVDPKSQHGQVSETILVVEDEQAVRDITVEYLRDLGYDVLQAEDGTAALQTLASHCRFDALVTDVGLPGELNGRQVADAARQYQPNLPVLFVTGYAGKAFDAQLAPGMEVMGKPFKLNVLATRLRTLLDDAQTVRRKPAA